MSLEQTACDGKCSVVALDLLLLTPELILLSNLINSIGNCVSITLQ